MYKDTLFYKIVRPIGWVLFCILFRPKIIGRENIPKDGGVVLAGNHTKFLDPVMLVCYVKRPVHFLAKDGLFHGPLKFFMKGMGCIPVNRKTHDKDALDASYKYLENNKCIGIFPEGTINRTDDVIMPFKMGAVKMSSKCRVPIVPFTIVSKYHLFGIGGRTKLTFYKPIKVTSNLEKSNEKLMNIVSKNLEREGVFHGQAKPKK